MEKSCEITDQNIYKITKENSSRKLINIYSKKKNNEQRKTKKPLKKLHRNIYKPNIFSKPISFKTRHSLNINENL